MSRSVPEWVASFDNEPVPPRVRLRVWDRCGGRCAECERKIAAGERWICDHTLALINGGENRERNLRVICDWCDRNVKTPADVALKAVADTQRKKHLGIKKAKRPIRGWRKFNGEPVYADRRET